MDLKLDSNGDLAIENDDFVLVDGIDAIAQDMDIRLKFFKGDWFLDTRLGIPYYEKILGQKSRLTAVKAIFRKAMETVEGVTEIVNLLVNYTGKTRRFSVSSKVRTEDGEFTYEKELII